MEPEKELIKKMIADVLGRKPEELSDQDLLTEDLCADSLELFRIAAEIEEYFDVEIPPEEAANIRSVQDAENVLNGLVVTGEREGKEA